MYLIITHVPIFKRGDQCLVSTDWKRSLLLLRDSLNGKLGPIIVLAPTLPDASVPAEQIREHVSEKADDIRLVGSFDSRCRAKTYWLRERKRWEVDIRRLLPNATLVHSGLDDVYRPIAYKGHLEATAAGLPTVYVQDGDIVERQRNLRKFLPSSQRLRSVAYAKIYERLNRYGIKRASMVLLKGNALVRRYGHLNRFHHNFVNTSYLKKEIVEVEAHEKRLASLKTGRQIRLLFCGRLIWEKGVDDCIRIVGKALERGADVVLDIIGDGPERHRLEQMVRELNIGQRVVFHGFLPYGHELLKKMMDSDILMFTSRAEETPRMIFDGYAAGLPLIGYPIGFVVERAEADGCCLPSDKSTVDSGVDTLYRLVENPNEIIDLSRRARKAAEYHCAEAWYKRRSEWTFEMMARVSRP